MTLPESDRVFWCESVGLAAALLFTLSNQASENGFTNEPNPDALRPYQIISPGEPPLSPAEFNPDAGVAPIRTNLFDEPETTLQLKRIPSRPPSPSPPAVFNPDPGAAFRPPPPPMSFFTNEFTLLPFSGDAIPESLVLPRTNLVSPQLFVVEPPPPSNYGREPLSKDLTLPRRQTRSNQHIQYQWKNRDYPLSRQGKGYPPNSEPETNRWRIGFAPWRRYATGTTETPYETPKPMLWHPYKQSLLKGDTPIIGQDIFLNLTAGTQTEFEARRVPTASGVSASNPGAAEFFGQSEQFSVQNNFSFAVELFEGETVFKPVHWALRLEPVFNVNYIDTRENNVINPNPVRGTDRTDDFIALQQAFFELHLGDLSDNYDFIAARFGNQPFNSDFRGFIFNDVNSGARIFGNIDNNRYQYNFMVLDMREKDTNSELNSFDEREQRVIIANLYRQDFIWKGYTAQLSLHANLDDGQTHYDRNGNIVRPAPIGTVKEHDVHAYYLGWAGDGHIGRLNISHAFYQVFGRDEFNGLAGRPVDINAQMAALELSYDRDWIRYKASFFYASGDSKAEDGKGNGFDTILDNPNFTGGPFSYWVRQGFNLAGTSVGLKQRNSLVPNLRTSKTEGQANFVNPGAFIFGVGTEIELTPKLRSFINVNYIRFVETDPIKTALLTDKVAHELGLDCSLGVQYRPLLTDNIILSAGFGTLIPGRGFKDIYQTSTDPVPGYNPPNNRGHVDDFLYSAIMAVTFTY
ncbi:MAG: hypothetical protein HY298_00275 [Verrucomicrobia bacterium]|nr:hypothetical protein [Verrucomicrobiota bacterium]